MILCLIKSFFGLVFRLLVVGLLIKSSLDIIAVNKETPKLIVERSTYFNDIFRDKLGINLGHDCFLRNVVKH
jgi:hypothetical protein